MVTPQDLKQIFLFKELVELRQELRQEVAVDIRCGFGFLRPQQ
jgi:hypothetical protein